LHSGGLLTGSPALFVESIADESDGEQKRGAHDRCHMAGTTQLTPLTIFFSFEGSIARFTALFQESNRGIETGTILFCPRGMGPPRLVPIHMSESSG
jgi:hypothetical protein